MAAKSGPPPSGQRPVASSAVASSAVAGRAAVGSAVAGHQARVRRPGQRQARPGRAGRTDPARRAAYDVLIAVEQRDAYANLLLPSVLAQRGLDGRDAALTTELTYGTLRGRGTYDAILGVCSDRSLDRIDPPLREVLRLGTHQLLATRVRSHAAVATSVDLARDLAGQRSAGFVNAVLRRVATRDLETWIGVAAPSRETDPLGHLAVRYSHPRWLAAALADALGEDTRGELAETEAALAADGSRPKVTLCAVPGLADQAELSEGGVAPAQWSPFGAYLDGGDPGADRGGTGAARGGPGRGQPASRDRARPGGADRAGPAVAGHVRRAGRQGPAAGRTGRAAWRAPAGGGRAAAPGPAGPRRGAASPGQRPRWRRTAAGRLAGRGVRPGAGRRALHRHRGAAPPPGSPVAQVSRERPALGGLQRRLLRSALDAARPGGVVGYVTCSPHLAETRGVLADVLRDRDDVDVLDAPAVLAEVPGLRCPEPGSRYAQFWPHRHGTDAIFLALLRRAC